MQGGLDLRLGKQLFDLLDRRPGFDGVLHEHGLTREEMLTEHKPVFPGGRSGHGQIDPQPSFGDRGLLLSRLGRIDKLDAVGRTCAEDGLDKALVPR